MVALRKCPQEYGKPPQKGGWYNPINGGWHYRECADIFLGGSIIGVGQVTSTVVDLFGDHEVIETTGSVVLVYETCGGTQVRGLLGVGSKLVYTCRAESIPELEQILRRKAASYLIDPQPVTHQAAAALAVAY